MLLDAEPIDLDTPGWAYKNNFDGHLLLAEFEQGKRELIPLSGSESKFSLVKD